MYKFTFDGWDTIADQGNQRYQETKNDVNIKVVADNEADALAKVQALTTREVWRLSRITPVF